MSVDNVSSSGGGGPKPVRRSSQTMMVVKKGVSKEEILLTPKRRSSTNVTYNVNNSGMMNNNNAEISVRGMDGEKRSPAEELVVVRRPLMRGGSQRMSVSVERPEGEEGERIVVEGKHFQK
jgi:hypothetical protein